MLWPLDKWHGAGHVPERARLHSTSIRAKTRIVRARRPPDHTHEGWHGACSTPCMVEYSDSEPCLSSSRDSSGELAGPEPTASSLLLQPRIDAARACWRLSTRQTQVLELVALGESNKAIAHILCLAEVTVEAHLTALLRKSGADSRTNLAVRVWAQALNGMCKPRRRG